MPFNHHKNECRIELIINMSTIWYEVSIMKDEIRTQIAQKTVGTWELVFQSMGQITPITILAGLIVSIVSFSLEASPLAMLISFVAVLMAANTIYQFSGQVAHAGGYYAYVEYGLGKFMGKFTGMQYLLYQVSNLGLEYLIVIWGFSKSLNYAFGTSLPVWSGIVWMGSMIALSYVLMRRGARPSLRLAIILGAIQVLFVIILSLIIIPQASDNTLQTFLPSSTSGGWSGVFLGFIVGGYLAFAGYGSIVPMGEEAKSPKKTIRNALVIVVLIAGAIFILGSYAMVVGYGIGNLSTFSSVVIPGLLVARRYVGVAGAVVFIVINTFLSTYGTVVGMGTPLTRVMYALGRDNVLGENLSRVNQHGVPVNSINAAYLITILSAVIMGGVFYAYYGFYNGLYYAWAIFGTVATLSTLFIHILSNTSLTFLNIVGKVKGKILTWVVLPVLTTVLMGVAYYYSLLGITMPYLIAPIIFVAWIPVSAFAVYRKLSKSRSINFSEVSVE